MCMDSTNGRQPPDDENPTVPQSSTPIIQSVPLPIPTAPTKPPFHNDNLSKGKRQWPLTWPMISYCPPSPPPHQQGLYPHNVAKTLRRPKYQPYMTQQNATQYYNRRHYYTQYGADSSSYITADNSYLALPAPTVAAKNLLRPP